MGQINPNESKVTALIVCSAVPIPFLILFTGLRLFVKLQPSSQNSMAFDDYIIVIATAMTISLCIIGVVIGLFGFGKHEAEISTEDLKNVRIVDLVFMHFYNFAIASTKLAILSLYYRIFSIVTFRHMIIGSVIFILSWMCAMDIVLWFSCIPISDFLNAKFNGSCINTAAFSYSTCAINILTDMWVFLLPIPTIFRLHMTQSKRLELAAIFSIGLLTCAISIAKLTVIVSQDSSDFTWNGVPLGLLSLYEPLGGVFCANLPFIYRWMAGSVEKDRCFT